jgi:hypothetical protein
LGGSISKPISASARQNERNFVNNQVAGRNANGASLTFFERAVGALQALKSFKKPPTSVPIALRVAVWFFFSATATPG